MIHISDEWKKKYLSPDASLWKELWTVQIAVFWAVVCGFYMALPAFVSYVPPWVFAGLCCFVCLLILFARLTNQPGLPDL
jgi:membrane protein YdbS with pleckstrin-like domain